jgi:hypothetical protein
MPSYTVHKLINYLIAAIWLINGLYCKLMALVPRHELIISRICGNVYAGMLTRMIGMAEILMTIWILSGIRKQLNAGFQIIVIMTMNIAEFILVPDLLLWGRFNLVFACLLSGLIYYNTFVLYRAPLNHA